VRGFERRGVWGEHFADQVLPVDDAELHRADDALWDHEVVA
jgi:hypothetical protein